MMFKKSLIWLYYFLLASPLLGEPASKDLALKIRSFVENERKHSQDQYSPQEGAMLQKIRKVNSERIATVCQQPTIDSYFKTVDAIYSAETLRLMNEPTPFLFAIFKIFGFDFTERISKKSLKGLSFLELLVSDDKDFHSVEKQFLRGTNKFESTLNRIGLFVSDLEASLKFLKHIADVSAKKIDDHKKNSQSQEAQILSTESKIHKFSLETMEKEESYAKNFEKIETQKAASKKKWDDIKTKYAQLHTENQNIEIKIQEYDRLLKPQQGAESALAVQQTLLSEQLKAKKAELEQKKKDIKTDEEESSRLAQEIDKLKKKMDFEHEKQKEKMADSWGDISYLAFTDNKPMRDLQDAQKKLKTKQSKMKPIQTVQDEIRHIEIALNSLNSKTKETRAYFQKLESERLNLKNKLASNNKELRNKQDAQEEKNFASFSKQIEKTKIDQEKQRLASLEKTKKLNQELATQKAALEKMKKKWKQSRLINLREFERLDFINLTSHQALVSDELIEFVEYFSADDVQNNGLSPLLHKKLLALLSDLLKSGSNIQQTIDLFLPATSFSVFSPYLTVANLKSQDKHLDVEKAQVMGSHLVGFVAHHQALSKGLQDLKQDLALSRGQDKSWFESMGTSNLEEPEKLPLLLALMDLRRWQAQEEFSWRDSSRGGVKLLNQMAKFADECLKLP